MKPYRKEKVASAIHEIVADLLVRGLNDPRIDPLTTVTRVEVSGDLLVARVYVSVPGGQAVERRTLIALQHAGGHVRHAVAQGIDLRQCPEIRFEFDERAKKVRETMRILEENRQQHPEVFPPDEAEEELEDDEPDEDWDLDDDDLDSEDAADDER